MVMKKFFAMNRAARQIAWPGQRRFSESLTRSSEQSSEQSRLLPFSVLVLAAIVLTAAAAAQDLGNTPRGSDDDAVDSVSAPAVPLPLSADRIIAVLQQQPELLDAAKTIAAGRLPVDPDAITDDAIYAQIQRDPALIHPEVHSPVFKLVFGHLGTEIG